MAKVADFIAKLAERQQVLCIFAKPDYCTS